MVQVLVILCGTLSFSPFLFLGLSFSSVSEGVGPDGMKPPLIQSSVYVWLTTPR